jgi:hypothetical protein
VTPETLEIVKGPCGGQEDVNDEIAIILEDPLGVFVSLDADRHLAAVLHLQVNFIADGLVLAGIVAGADQKIICKTGDLSKIQDHNVLRLLGLSGPNCSKPISFRSFQGGFLLAVTWRLLG